MKIIEQFRSVFLSVTANKFRVILTSLGIIIGSFTIIMVVGIGKAGEASVTEEYKRLSVESITIQRASGGNAMRIGQSGPVMPRSLTKEELEAIPEELEHVKSIGISTSTNSSVVYGGNSKDVTILGINADYADITNLYLQFGEFFDDDDGLSRNKLVVLGSDLARYLFGEDLNDLYDAIGESVRIKGTSFTVVGILERVGGSGGIGGRVAVDDTAFVPYDVAVKYTTGPVSAGRGTIMMSSSMGGGISYIALANDMKSVSAAIAEIKEYIAEICGSATVYDVTDIGSTLSAALKTSNTMSTLLIAVAVIVLIVSGIGIMNVLMVAVSERTREIGIMKSLGAKRRTILSIFLLEAFFISVIGGLFGVCLSVSAPAVLAYFEIDFLATMDGLLLGLGFSVVTGIFFGYYPAYKASKLKPIDALNKE